MRDSTAICADIVAAFRAFSSPQNDPVYLDQLREICETESELDTAWARLGDFPTFPDRCTRMRGRAGYRERAVERAQRREMRQAIHQAIKDGRVTI